MLKVTIELQGANENPKGDGHETNEEYENSKVVITQNGCQIHGPTFTTLQERFDRAVMLMRKLLEGTTKIESDDLPF